MAKQAATIRSVPTPWRDIILVCRRCTKRAGGGFGKKRKVALRGALRVALNAAGRRREVRVIEIGCVSLCPKNAVTVARASRPGELLAIPTGADPADVLARLGATGDVSREPLEAGAG